jgi:hypothetical protein
MKGALRQFSLATFAFACLIHLGGCKASLLPNSNIKDTNANRSVMAFMDQYVQAIKKRDVQGIMNLVAHDFYEEDTPGKHDAYGHTQLQAKLEASMSRVTDVDLSVFVQNVVYKEKNLLEVTYFFSQHALVNLPSGDSWTTTNDVNQIVLRYKGNSFEIVRGL